VWKTGLESLLSQYYTVGNKSHDAEVLTAGLRVEITVSTTGNYKSSPYICQKYIYLSGKILDYRRDYWLLKNASV
jgi:hypothetical protein